MARRSDMTLWGRIRGLFAGSRAVPAARGQKPPPMPEQRGRPPHDVDFLDEMNRRRQERLDRLSAIARVQGWRERAG